MTDATSSDAGGAAVWLLALGQTLIYAGCYYSFPALLPDLEAATGWTKAELALGPTLAFLIMAARWLYDRKRGFNPLAKELEALQKMMTRNQ